MNKKMIILISMFIFMISLSAVSASDDMNETLEISDEAQLGVDAGTFTALQNKINAAPSGSTISLENDYTYNSGFPTDGIKINKPITINGNGHMINGLKQAQLFDITTSGTVILNNINFIGGNTGVGSNANLYVSNCNFNDNVGSITLFSTRYMKMTNCNFNDNENDDDWAGTVSVTHGDIINCNFNRNTAVNSALSFAGSVYEESYVSTVNGCVFNGNDGTFSGGINTFSNEKISNCKFISNTGSVGAIRVASDCEIRDCEFISNNASNAGAIYCESDVSFESDEIDFNNINVYGSRFISNRGEYGGAVINAKLISDCYFEGNDGNKGTGGAVLSCEKITGSTFISNHAESGGAVCQADEIINCIFTDNKAETGGAIDSSKKITGSRFTNNVANEGGSIYLNLFLDESGTVTIADNEFKSDYNHDFIYFYGNEDNVLYMNNNKMTANNDYDICLDGKISFEVNLVFSNTTTAPNSKIILCELYDDSGNSIRTTGTVNAVLTNIEDHSVKNVEIESDIDDNAFYYNCIYNDDWEELPLPDGVYSVEGTIASDNIKSYSTKKGVLTIDSDTNYILTSQNLTKYYGSPDKFAVTLTNGNNRPIPGASVEIEINGQKYYRTTNSNGVASMNINLVAGNYSVKCSYQNARCNASINVLTTLYGDDLTKFFRNDSQYYVTCLDTSGNKIASGSVDFNINGVFYTRTITNGVAKMNINLEPGEYVITAKNLINSEQHSNTIKVLSTISENNDLTKYFRNASQYSIRILDGQGNPAGEGIAVTFNINGVFYTRYSNASGYVKMNINLEPGEYIITANYNGLMASNTIRVLSILEGKDVNMGYRDGTKYEVRLLDGAGNPYPGQKVTLNINGVFYERVTDSEGIARLNINLMSGSYIITASYNGQNIANTIIISPPNVYECANGHRLEISNAVPVKRNDNHYYISYPDGNATLSFYQYDDFDRADYLVMSYDFNYMGLGSYGKWSCIELTMHEYPVYEMFYYDGYLYDIIGDDLDIIKRVADSFR